MRFTEEERLRARRVRKASFNPFVLLLLLYSLFVLLFLFLFFVFSCFLLFSFSISPSWFFLMCFYCISVSVSLSHFQVIRSLRCDRRPQDTCQDVRLRLFGLIWVAAFRRKCSDGFKVMPKTGSPPVFPLCPPCLRDSRRRLTRRIHNLSPNFNCYVSVYITLFCLLDVSNSRDSRHAWINVMKSPKETKK